MKTGAWDEMAAMMVAPLPNPGFYPTMTWNNRLENQKVLAAEQIFKLAPLPEKK